MNCGKLAVLACGLLALPAMPERVVTPPAAVRVTAPDAPRTVRVQVELPQTVVRELHHAGYDWRQKGRWELAGDTLVLSYDVEEPASE